MKIFLPVFLFLLFPFTHLFASHIVGGEIFYTYLGPGASANSSRYLVTLRLFTDCNQVCGGEIACPPGSVKVGIYTNAFPYNKVTEMSLPRTANPTIDLTTYPPCLNARPSICYRVNTYSAEVQLNNTTEGYRLSYQTCCRAGTINVLPDDGTLSGIPGATYETVLPGTKKLPVGNNSNAVVNLKDTSLVCFGSPFVLDFGAVDPDGDSLSYQLSAAYDGGSFQSSSDSLAPDNPLYDTVGYTTGYTGSSPLGGRASINPVTGIISGIAPSAVGKYVVNVIIKEWRNGQNIAEHQKDFIMKVENCVIPKAILNPDNRTCDGFTRDFFNAGSNNGVNSWYWDFGVPDISTDTSSSANPTFTYPDTGTFVLKLIINRGTSCIDSATQLIKVYPGFFPGLRTNPPYCAGTPVQFNDQTRTNYGTVSAWHWDFGVAGITSDTSNVKNPTFVYKDTGSYTIELTSSNSYGCSDTVTTQIVILGQPNIHLNDTLICDIDTLQLKPDPSNSYTWSPNYMISSLTATNPFVSPDVPTMYYARFIDRFGCVNRDSVFVNVKSFVTTIAANDTAICRNDSIQLKVVSDALHYQWTPPGSLNDPSIQNPVATPVDSIVTYTITGSIGKCNSSDRITVRTIPYPTVTISPDTGVCYGRTVALQASGGVSYAWSPATFLSSVNTPNTISVNPTRSIRYTVAVTDNKGCPKPTLASTWVKVRDQLVPNTGVADTMSIVIGQSVSFNASGGDQYLWTPDQWLSNPNSAVAVATPQNDITYRLKVTQVPENCIGFDSVKIRVYFLPPSFYVPTAFSPNGDGINDVLRPRALGMRSIRYFRVYNRFGNLLFETSELNKGWDGDYKGNPQDPATYVWMAQGETYKGEFITRKGTAVLVR